MKGVKNTKNTDIHLHSQSLLNKKSILPRSSIFRHSYWQSIGSSFGAIGARSTFRSYSFSHKEEKHNTIWDSGFVHKWPIFCSYCKRPKKWLKIPLRIYSPQNGHFLGGISNWFHIVVQNWNCFSLQPLFFWFYWYIDIISMISPTITISSQIHDLCGVWSSSDWHLHNIDFSSQCNKDFSASSSWLIMAPMWGLNFSFQQHWSGDLRSIYHFYRVCFSKPKLISI